MDENPAQLLTYSDVEQQYKIKKATLAWWVHEQMIPHIRLGARTVRFERDELEKWLAERSVAAKGARND